jgi:hypothetical protein
MPGGVQFFFCCREKVEDFSTLFLDFAACGKVLQMFTTGISLRREKEFFLKIKQEPIYERMN